MNLFSTEEVLHRLPELSESVQEAAGLLDPLNGNWLGIERELHSIQERAARHKTAIFDHLCRTLITPHDPEDLLQLSTMLVAALDEISATGDSFHRWFPAPPPPPLVELCRLLLQATSALDKAMNGFLGKRLQPDQFREFSLIRSQANQIVNGALAELFETERDTTALLRKRELYKHPHTAIARCCETAANLRTIALKNG